MDEPTPQIELDGVTFAWDRERDLFLINGMPAVGFLVESTIASLMWGLERMVGRERFNLALQAAGRESITGEWEGFIAGAPSVGDGLTTLGRLTPLGGLGRWEVVAFDLAGQTARFRVTSGWEPMYQARLGSCWGSSFIAGKFAGYCSRAFGMHCWAEQTAFAARGEPYDEFVVRPSQRGTEERLEELLYAGRATAADLAAALERLRCEVEERRRAELMLEERVQERTEALSKALGHLQATQRHLIESEKMAALGGLVAGVAHEISTPVGVGITAASLLHESVEGLLAAYEGGTMTRSDLERFLEQVRQGSAMVLGNLERAAGLIQSFKQVAVDQSSEAPRSFPVRAYVENVVLSLQPQLKRTRHTLAVEGDPALVWSSYPGALAQIVTNIVLNALTHAFEPGQVGRIRVTISRHAETIRLEFCDDGRGIPPQHLPRLFEPFFTTARDRGGSGLGLYIVYNLVTQRFHGTIRCESAPGEGARFIIEAPLVTG